jgi:hypothetical protein
MKDVTQIETQLYELGAQAMDMVYWVCYAVVFAGFFSLVLMLLVAGLRAKR